MTRVLLLLATMILVLSFPSKVMSQIHSQTILKFTNNCQQGSSPELMAGEIKGLNCYLHKIQPGVLLNQTRRKGFSSVYLISSGNGEIIQDNKVFKINEIALFVPTLNGDFSISSATTELTILEFALALNAGDNNDMERFKSKSPYFISYSNCKTYKEAIKSEQTISRTILPADNVPRFSIGSVETEGPDEVARHTHPMLEQLFFGLPDNDCLVSADDNEINFSENVLLHIPLGSEHEVKVSKGKKLHYVWIDLFWNREDMEYLLEEHKEEE